jgi:hypothetical protein
MYRVLRRTGPLGALFVTILFTVFVGPLSAATVNVLVLESGEGPFPFESSALWESCLLDVFFEAGHVVSNSPVLRPAGGFPGGEGAGEFPGELLPELEALEGVDYLVLVFLAYPSPAAGPGQRPEELRFRVYSFKAGEGSPAPGASAGGGRRLVWEGRFSLEAGEAERERASDLIRGLIPHIKD